MSLLLTATSHAGDERCADRIMSIGDTAGELLIRCGEPDWVQYSTEEMITFLDQDNKRKVTIAIEEWTYDVGPNRFMRIFTLRDNKIVDIRTGDYGVSKEGLQPGCSDRVISKGDTAAEVMAKCGEPFHKESREEAVSERIDADNLVKVSVIVEDWTYNFGSDRFLRIFTFRNGKVTDIRTGGYGN
jgi:hypothetical protein